MRRKLLFGAASVIVALAIVAPAAASWTTYWGPGTFRSPPNSPQSAFSGYNYWTNNEVYRPTGHPFFLAYNDGSWHYSTENSGMNPFYFPAYGYNELGCLWDYSNDTATSVYPVTCEGYS